MRLCCIRVFSGGQLLGSSKADLGAEHEEQQLRFKAQQMNTRKYPYPLPSLTMLGGTGQPDEKEYVYFSPCRLTCQKFTIIGSHHEILTVESVKVNERKTPSLA